MLDTNIRKLIQITWTAYRTNESTEECILFLSCVNLNVYMFQQKKNGAVFEVAEVIPVMTNNYEDSIMKGVKVTCKFKVTRKMVS